MPTKNIMITKLISSSKPAIPLQYPVNSSPKKQLFKVPISSLIPFPQWMITGIFPSEVNSYNLFQNCLLNLFLCLNSTDIFFIPFIFWTIRQPHNSINLTTASSSSNPVPHHHQKFIYKSYVTLCLRIFQIP